MKNHKRRRGEDVGDFLREQNPPFNFGGLESEFSRFDESWATIIPVPYDATTTYRTGTREGPSAILEASRQLELYDEEVETEVYRRGIATLSPVPPLVSSPEAMVNRVKDVVSEVIRGRKLPVLIGGEHLLSLGAIRALRGKSKLSVLHLDAHADLRKSYQGSAYSNACVMRLVHKEVKFVSVGIRCLSAEEHLCLKKNKIPHIFAKDFLTDPEAGRDFIVSNLVSPVYVTVDLDVLDPSIMPAVGTPEPGGLGWYELLSILRYVSMKFEIAGFDVMELLPQSMNISPDFLAARLIYKILSYVAISLDKESRI